MRGTAILVFLALLGAGQGQNLLQNPSFEGDLTGTWDNNGFLMERVAGDTVDGNFALKASYRDRDLEGPQQTLYNLKPGSRYEVSLSVKLLNDISGTLWQPIKVIMQYSFSDTGELGTYFIANRGLCDSSMGWIYINGSMNAPVRAFNWVRFAIRGPDPWVNFLVDNVKLSEVPENSNWLADSHTNIEKYRKSNISLSFNVPAGVSASSFDLQVRLKKHMFPFGAKIKDTMISQQPTNEYSKLVYYMFNWATVQSYKWKFDKGNRYNPNFSNAVSATNALLANGMKVRGHNIFWDVEPNIPDWVLALSGQELQDVLNNHLLYMCSIALGKLEHWDVQNEHTHEQYYEEKLQDRNVTKNFFRMMRTCDNATKLFFNDYQAVDIGGSTEDYYQLLKQYLAESVPVQGLGVQGHVKPDLAPDPTTIWKRLDRLGMLGLDIVLSEFDVAVADLVQRADWIEDGMRAFFSHPVTKGVIYWAFWDLDSQDPYKEMVQGNSLTIVEPGQRYICLVKKEWTTNVVRNLGAGTSFTVRGFQGDYEVIVRRSGVPVQLETFSLGQADTSVNIQVTSTTAAVTVVEERDYVPRCVSHRNQKSLGQVGTTSTSTALTCNYVISAASGANEDDEVSVGCATDQVMTGCTSFQADMLWTRKGEKIVIENGVARCKAYNGRNSPSGVKATARCCKVAGLTCEYRVAGPSSPFDGAQAEAVCPASTLPMGCSTYSQYPDMDGVFANATANSCVAQSGNPASAIPGERSGSTVTAACCSAPGITCMRVATPMTTLIAANQQMVVCPAGYLMVSCDYFAADGRAGGARIYEVSGVEKCKASMGDNMPAGSKGVIGTATCCAMTN